MPCRKQYKYPVQASDADFYKHTVEYLRKKFDEIQTHTKFGSLPSRCYFGTTSKRKEQKVKKYFSALFPDFKTRIFNDILSNKSAT